VRHHRTDDARDWSRTHEEHHGCRERSDKAVARMRKTIARAVYNDAELNSLGITRDSINSGDVDTPSQRPYIVFRWGETNPGVDVVRQRSLVVWVHDRPNDYDRIDQIIKRIRDVLTSIAAQR